MGAYHLRYGRAVLSARFRTQAANDRILVNRIHLAGITGVTAITLVEGEVVACFSFNLSM
jgi:hypothetical protein